MVRVALPTGTINDSGWTLVGDASVALCIDEGVDTADDGTTYAQSTTPGETFEVSLSDIGTPPPTKGAGHKIRVRARDVGIAVLHGEFTVELWQDGGVLFTSGRQITNLGHAWTTFEIDCGFSSPLTHYDGLSIVLVDTDSGPGQRIRISALEFVAPSEVEIPAPTAGYSTTTGAMTGAGLVPGGSSASATAASARATSGLAVAASITSASKVAAGFGATVGVLLMTTVGASSSAAACRGTGGVTGFAAGTSQAAASPIASGRVAGSTAGSSLANYGDDAAVDLGPYETIARALRSRFNANVTQASPLETAWDNGPFAVPGTNAYVRLSTACEASELIAIGPGITNRYRMRGEITASVHVAVGSGTTAALEIVDDIATGFRGAIFFPMTMRAPVVSGGYRDGADWRIDVRVPFVADFDIDRLVGAAPITLSRSLAAGVVASRFDTLNQSLGLTALYDNGPDDSEPPIDEQWVRFSIVHGTQQAVEHVGSQLRYRTVGIAYATLRGPIEQGERDLIRMGDTIADAFRSVSDRGVTFRTPLVRANRREGPWWRVDVTCPFSWDEIA